MTEDGLDRKWTMREHLRELAYRIKMCLLWVVGSAVVAFIFREAIMEWLMAPLAPALGADPRLHFASPIDPFFTYMRLALHAGLFFAFPALLWHVWSFIGPGLRPRERRFILGITIWGVLFFLTGVAFAYYLVFPYGFDWLLEFARTESGSGGPAVSTGGLVLQDTIMMDGYLRLITSLMLAFGVMFELPLVIYWLAVSQIVSIRGLMRFFRYFVVIAFILAAILTPPDVVTQVLLGVPLVLMYLASVGVAALVIWRRKPGR